MRTDAVRGVREEAPSAASGVACVSLDEPLRPVTLDGRSRLLLVVTAGEAVVGETVVEGDDEVAVETQREAIHRACGERLLARELAAAFLRSARGVEPDAPELSASVIVAPAPSGGELRPCLESLAALSTSPLEVLVYGRAHSGDDHEACAELGARTIDGDLQSAVAQSRGEVIALTDDASRPGRAWLDGLGLLFDDPLAVAATGYVGPLELRTRSQWRAHRALAPESFDGATFTRFTGHTPVLRPGNVLLRRELLEESGLPAGRGGGLRALQRGGERVAARLLRAGYRVVFDPARITWRRHPRAYAPPTAALAVGSLRGGGLRQPRPRPAARGRLPRVTGPEQTPVSVTISSHNRRERLAQVLNALARQTYPADMLETVVVLDGSTDGSAERARALDLPYSLRLVEQDNRGLAASRNRAVREASAPIVVALDDDIVPEPGFVAAHAEAHRLARGPHVALGHCPQATPVKDLASLSGWHWYTDFYRRRSEPNHVWNYTDFGDGNASLPRATVLELGGWDEQFPDNQDWELGLRLLGKGVTFGDYPEAVGLHYAEVGLSSMLRKERVHGRADVALGRKHPQLLSHLQLAYFVTARPWSRLLSLTYRWPRTIDLLARPARLLASALERAERPSLWSRTLGILYVQAYAMGVRDAVPTLEQFRELVAPITRKEGIDSIEVRLDRPGSLNVPPTAGQVELVLAYGSDRIASVDAPAPRQQWDWEDVAQLVVNTALEPFGRALRRRPDELPELAAGVREALTAVGASRGGVE